MIEKALRKDRDSEMMHLLFQFMDEVRGIIDTVAAEHDLTRAQVMVLRRLEKPHAMRSIADGLSCDPSNITGLVDRLEAQDLVKRVPDSDDRRVKMIVRSDRGREVQAAIHDQISRRVNELAGLDEGERKQLLKLLRRMTAE